AVAGPYPHEQVDAVRLNRQRQHLPALLRTLALDQLPTAGGHWSDQHRLAAARAPDQVLDDEMNAVLIPLVLMSLFLAS
ncbi:MAG TPA: hypothetical protein VF916_16070, partial [Ktedonobacterales bacterium]